MIKKQFRLSRKASLSISLEAIVVIVIAMTILGLGLGFVTDLFKDIGKTREEAFKPIEKQLENQLRSSLESSGDRIGFISDKLSIEAGKADSFLFGVKNVGAQRTYKINISIIKGLDVNSNSINITNVISGKKLEFLFTEGPYTIGQNDIKTHLIRYATKKDTLKGTYLLQVDVGEPCSTLTPQIPGLSCTFTSPGVPSPGCTCTAEQYASSVLFVDVQ